MKFTELELEVIEKLCNEEDQRRLDLFEHACDIGVNCERDYDFETRQSILEKVRKM